MLGEIRRQGTQTELLLAHMGQGGEPVKEGGFLGEV